MYLELIYRLNQIIATKKIPQPHLTRIVYEPILKSFRMHSLHFISWKTKFHLIERYLYSILNVIDIMNLSRIFNFYFKSSYRWRVRLTIDSVYVSM